MEADFEEVLHQNSSDDWLEYFPDSPVARFVFTFIGLPILIIAIVYAYMKTLQLGFNTYAFYQRFKKSSEGVQYTSAGHGSH